MASSKRPVARHACLACREKKIKCDGEQPPLAGDSLVEMRRQRCTNCRTLGLECVFVRSQRGGRRKKDPPARDSLDESVSVGISTPPSISGTSNGMSSWLQSPLMSAPESLPGGSLNGGGSNHALQEKVQRLQREAASLQSQLLDQTGSQQGMSPQRAPASEYGGGFRPAQEYGFRRHESLDQGPGMGPPPWKRQGWHGGPYGRHGPGHHHHHHHPEWYGPPGPNGGHMPPPPPSAPPMDGRPPRPPPHDSNGMPLAPFNDDQRKRPYLGEFDMNLPKLSRTTRFINVEDEELEQFDLPNWRTTCILIDLYYRYIHPSRPFLPPKHRLIYQLQVRHDASLLHAMFSSSCRFASSMVLPSANLRDPQHWYFLAEKYWDLMDLDVSLQALVLLMGALGPGGYVQQSIEGSERTHSLMKVTKTLEAHNIKDWKQYANIATKRQAVRHEDMLRTIWSSWKLNVFIRMNRGSPFNKLSTKLLEFPSDLPLPLSDTLFNANMNVFETNNNHALLQLHYRSWSELEVDVHKAAVGSGELATFSDSDLTVLAVKQMEDIMDTVSSGFLNSVAVNRFNAQMKVIDGIANASLYQISHIKKKMAIVNISKLFALLLNQLCKVVINVTQCHQILLIKPHETQSNSNPDDVFNSLYKSKLVDIHDGCMSISPEQLQHFVAALMAALDTVHLIELGMGRIPEASSSTVPIQVVGGPVDLTPAHEISSLKTSENWWVQAIQEPGKSMSAQVQTYNEFPDIWLQYPIFSVVVVANALTVLASSVVLTKMITIREVEASSEVQASGLKQVEWVIGDNQRIIPMTMDEHTLATMRRYFNVMEIHQSISLCSKYIHAHGRFWPYVESVSFQVEAIINYIDDIVTKN